MQMSSSEDLSESLVQAACTGASGARDRLLPAMRSRLVLMAAARLTAVPNRWCAVEEVVQESLVALLQGLDRLEDRTVAGLKRFAAGIVAHKAADYLKSDGVVVRRRPAVEARWRKQSGEAASVGGAFGIAALLMDSRPSPRSAARRHEAVQLVLTLIGGMSLDQQEVLTLAFFDQLTTVQIGQHLGITREAASMRVCRAVKALRSMLSDSTCQERADGERKEHHGGQP